MPPHLRWRTTALQSLARRSRNVSTRTKSRLCQRPESFPGIFAANLNVRRYANVAGSTVHATRAEHEDTNLRVGEQPGSHSDVSDIIHATKDALVSVQGIRNEDSKAIEQISVACEFFLQADHDESQPTRISVYGSEDSSAVSNLVTTLLDDPLSSDETLRQVISGRLLGGKDGELLAPHRFTSYDLSNTLRLPSSFFSRFQSQVVLEDLSTQRSNSLSSILISDIPVFVYSPFTPTQSALNFFHHNPNALLVIDGGLDPSSVAAKAFRTRLASQIGCEPSRAIVIDSARALRGIEALRAAPLGTGSAQAVARYQEDVLAAQLPQLLSLLAETEKRGKVVLRRDAALALAGQVVTIGRATVQLRSRDADAVRSIVSALQEAVLEMRERILVEMFGGDENVVVIRDGKDTEKGPISKGVENVTKALKPVLDGIKWWRLPFAVDEVSKTVDGAVERAYAKEFENPLVFQTGRLAHLQFDFTTRTSSITAHLPTSFHSPLLENTLAQLRTHPSYPINASALLGPISSRTSQLAYATRALHLSAQRAVLGAFASSAVSVGGAYALWVTQALGAVDVSSATAGATLGALVGVRWGVGAWARARRLWLADCARVGEGFERDVKRDVEEVWTKQVAVVPMEACRLLNEAVEKRREGVGKVEDAVEGLELTTRGTTRRPSAETAVRSADGLSVEEK